MQKSKKKISEEKAAKMIVRGITAVVFIYVAICSISFIVGQNNKYNDEITRYRREAKGEGGFANIELLQFMNTDDVIEYKNVVAQALEADSDIGRDSNITILDVITYDQDSNIYEWLFALDDRNESTFYNSFNGNEHTFSVYRFTEPEIYEDTENPTEQSVQGEYFTGSIQNINDTAPEISNIDILEPYIGDINSSQRTMFIEGLKTFLIDTKNNRRSFSVKEDSVQKTRNGFECVVTADIKLENNNIKIKYDKVSDTYECEYVD